LERAEGLNGDGVDVRAWTLGLQGMTALLDGENARALTMLEQAVAVLRTGAVASSTAWWGLWHVLRTAADGKVPPRGPETDLAMVQGANAAALAYARAIAAGAEGDITAAECELAAADALVARAPHWRNLMRLLVSQAAVDAGWGNPASWATECLVHFDGREPLFATLARNLLRRAGVPVPRRRAGTELVPPELRNKGVTGREIEVLLLVADNLTNAEIGRRLFLSPRTVETHIKHLMQKLGVSRRGELAAAANAARAAH
jgi:DNA-binding CsgD family transcriptional regulator